MSNHLLVQNWIHDDISKNWYWGGIDMTWYIDTEPIYRYWQYTEASSQPRTVLRCRLSEVSGECLYILYFSADHMTQPHIHNRQWNRKVKKTDETRTKIKPISYMLQRHTSRFSRTVDMLTTPVIHSAIKTSLNTVKMKVFSLTACILLLKLRWIKQLNPRDGPLMAK